MGLPADCAPRAQIRPAPAAWLPKDWLLALEMRVISAMTFLFRLDVYVWGDGGKEGFSHSMCVCVCLFAYTCTSSTAWIQKPLKPIPTASFFGIFLSLQYCPNGLRPVHRPSTIFRVYLLFPKLSGLVSEVDRKWGRRAKWHCGRRGWVVGELALSG